VPRLSVIIPVYNVERYVGACLDSLLAQQVEDFEAIVVDDGSPDGSLAIAEAYAERDPRIRIIRQPNGGLGSARNTGIDHACGEFLAFLDSDDMVTPDGYARLLAALERSGSDFATGNIHRFDAGGAWQAAFVSRVYLLPRRRTHVSRFRWLLSDRMAQNKLWRRSFWDAHGLRFPVGCFHEDIHIVLSAHALARSVDVVKAPVYLYRERDDGVLSITQRRAELRTLEDRLAAVEHASAFLGTRSDRLQRWYDESVIEDDLRYHLDVLDEADLTYRELFLERANAFLDRGPLEARLPAIQRLKWWLVRERRVPELLEVLRFQKAGGAARKVRIGARTYGDYPFLDDGIPRSVYRLDTARRRARHVAVLARPYVTPHAPLTRARLALPPPRSLPGTMPPAAAPPAGPGSAPARAR
jgi:CDP-glycerol glycerophosphotransferase